MTIPGYTKIKAKCLDCSLHFVLCSWHPDRHSAKSLFCPGCGQHQGDFLVWTEQVSGFISQEVPGNASPLPE
jgi:hypothetical protein